MPGCRRFSPAAGNLPDGSAAAQSADAAVACSPAGLPGAAGLGGAARRRLPNHPGPVLQPPASLSHRRRVPAVKAVPKMGRKAPPQPGVLGRGTSGEALVVWMEGARPHSSHLGKRDQGLEHRLGGWKSPCGVPTFAHCKRIPRSDGGLGRRRENRGDTWRVTPYQCCPLANHEMSFWGSAGPCLTPQGAPSTFPGPDPAHQHSPNTNYRVSCK